jgi:hypothetical protein
MGYYSFINGDATIEPPIDEKHWPDEWHCDNGDGYFNLSQVDGDETVAVVNGQVTVVGKSSGHTVVDFAFDDSVKAYDIDQ